MTDRETWLRENRRENVRQEDVLAPGYDAQWGAMEETHRAFVTSFLERLPPAGRVLDAACGTGKYFGLVLASGRALLGVDHSPGALAVAGAKFPGVALECHDLQELPLHATFDGVMCVDAMEFVPPEEWPAVLARFHQVLHPGGWLYLTVELVREEELREVNAKARAAGLPVTEREVIWGEAEGYYHHYPAMAQVRAWLTDGGFRIEEEAEGPWHEEGYAYHHLLAQAA